MGDDKGAAPPARKGTTSVLKRAMTSPAMTSPSLTTSLNKIPFKLLELKVIAAHDLPPVSKYLHTYVMAWVHPENKMITPVDHKGNTNPMWNFRMVFGVDDKFLNSESSAVMVEIYNISKLSNRPIGTTCLPVEILLNNPHSEIMKKPLKLPISRPSGDLRGYLFVTINLVNTTIRNLNEETEASPRTIMIRQISQRLSHAESAKRVTYDEDEEEEQETDDVTTLSDDESDQESDQESEHESEPIDIEIKSLASDFSATLKDSGTYSPSSNGENVGSGISEFGNSWREAGDQNNENNENINNNNNENNDNNNENNNNEYNHNENNNEYNHNENNNNEYNHNEKNHNEYNHNENNNNEYNHNENNNECNLNENNNENNHNENNHNENNNNENNNNEYNHNENKNNEYNHNDNNNECNLNENNHNENNNECNLNENNNENNHNEYNHNENNNNEYNHNKNNNEYNLNENNNEYNHNENNNEYNHNEYNHNENNNEKAINVVESGEDNCLIKEDEPKGQKGSKSSKGLKSSKSSKGPKLRSRHRRHSDGGGLLSFFTTAIMCGSGTMGNKHMNKLKKKSNSTKRAQSNDMEVPPDHKKLPHDI